MRLLIGLALMALGGPALAADGWVVVKGEDVGPALAGHVLAYADGATQSFGTQGDTVYDGGRRQPGNWRIEGDRYCSVWPPSDLWACYGLERSADGMSLRFTADDGSTTEGRYADPE